MGLVFFPNYKAAQERIASIKASFREAAKWTGEAPEDSALKPALIIKPEAHLDDGHEEPEVVHKRRPQRL